MPILLDINIIFVPGNSAQQQFKFSIMNVKRFKYAKLTKVLKDGHYWFSLEIDGDLFWCRSYAHAIKTLLEILVRDGLPNF